MPSTAPPDIRDITRRGEVALTSSFGDDVRISELSPLPGGASSLTYIATLTAGLHVPEHVVIKVAPPGLDPVRNRDVLRQARLLSALADQPGIGVPTVYGTDDGSPPEVPPLFVMSFVEGESFEPLRTRDGEVPTDEQIRQRTESATEMLTRLQDPLLPPRFPDEHAVTLEEEIGRWAKALATVDPAWVPAANSCQAALSAAIPDPLAPAILHGDWRLGNMQCADGEVRAVIDWEIWSIGDPRIDLAWYCMMMDRTHPGVMVDRVGTPTPTDIVRAYEKSSGSLVVDFDWFLALMAYKQSATSALISKNAIRRDSFGPDDQRRVELAGSLLTWCLEILG